MPCIETMNPLDSGVETSAWYIGMQVTRMPRSCQQLTERHVIRGVVPIPTPAKKRAKMNMPTLTEPAQRAAPMLRMTAPIYLHKLVSEWN